MTITARLDHLRQIHKGLFAPVFRALENYGAGPIPEPTEADILGAMRRALDWHRDEVVKVARELRERTQAHAANNTLIAGCKLLIAHHNREAATLEAELAKHEKQEGNTP